MVLESDHNQPNNHDHNNHSQQVDWIRVARNNIDITFLIMKQRSDQLWNNGSELWNNDINIDIT
jgi:hypothetical protein